MQHLPPGGWPSFSLSNHDQLNQLVSRVGQENMQAITVMHYALGGTTIVYYPDLIGMEDNQNLTLANSKDIQGLNATNEDGTKGNLIWSRDFTRSPMEWEPGKNNGFSPADTHKIWLPPGTPRKGGTVKEQLEDSHSLLRLHQRMNNLRRETPALQSGKYRSFSREVLDDGIYFFERQFGQQTVVVAMNFSANEQVVSFSRGNKIGKLLISTDTSKRENDRVNNIHLLPHEAQVIEMTERR